MKFDAATWIMSPYVLLFLTISTGILLGKVKLGRFKLGIGGPLFTGIIFGWLIMKYAESFSAGDSEYKAASTLIKNSVIPSTISTIFLILFVASVGLLAASDIERVIKKYGVKFILLGFIITCFGAALTYSATYICPNLNSYEVTGVYTGALTSSPGLAASLEASEAHATRLANSYSTLSQTEKAKLLKIMDPTGSSTVSNTPSLTDAQKATYIKQATASTGTGNAMTFPFGIISVIFAMTIIPKVFRINLNDEIENYNKEVEVYNKREKSEKSTRKVKNVLFDLAAFAFACFAGYTLGSISIKLGPIGEFSLGSTGGVLIGSLILGYIGKIGPLSFRMDKKIIGTIQKIGLGSFVGTVGLKYGDNVVHALTGEGIYMVILALIIAFVCMIVGFIIGKYVFKIGWVMLSGGICGGMTSTPGLGAAVDCIGSDAPAAGYAATYPFALIGMVLFTLILHTLPY